jgi:hypothetical protein
MEEEKEGESRGMSRMRCERLVLYSLHPSLKYLFSFWQASLVRESENMVRDTATRLERAAGELGDLIVRATLSPPFL